MTEGAWASSDGPSPHGTYRPAAAAAVHRRPQAAQVFEPPPSPCRGGSRRALGTWQMGRGKRFRSLWGVSPPPAASRLGRGRWRRRTARGVVPGTRQPAPRASGGGHRSQRARRDTAAVASPAPRDPGFPSVPGVPGRRTWLGPPGHTPPRTIPATHPRPQHQRSVARADPGPVVACALTDAEAAWRQVGRSRRPGRTDGRAGAAAAG